MRKITAKGQSTSYVVDVKKNSSVTIKNVDLECIKAKGQKANMYGIYCAENSVVNFESGKIHTSDSACISTNGNDKPGCTINIKGGELTNDNSYAIYMPAFGEINISGGTTQAINMRRGTLNVTGGKISKVAYTKEEADKIENYPTYSGLVWLGDTVAILSGSNGYIKEEGEEIIINVSGGTVEKSFGTDAPFTVYCLDTATFNQVVKFTGVAKEDIKIVSHEEIKEKTKESYTPKSQTTVFVDGEQIFPVNEESIEEPTE